MSSKCYSMVRGSAIRVTGLGSRGQVPELVRYATSKSVAKVTIHERIEEPANEVISNPEEERRLHLIRPAQNIGYMVDVDFIRVDPGVLSLVTGVPVVSKGAGFGEGLFGMMTFGDGATTVVGFDATTRLPAVSFALEVWSKLAGHPCGDPKTLGFGETPFDETPFDESTPGDRQRMWGYTLFPHLRGGHMSGFTFANGLVSFNLIGAQTRRYPRWGAGPYDIEGPFERLLEPVSRNTSWKTFMAPAAPPAQVDGIQEFVDAIDSGTAANPMPNPAAPLALDAGGVDTTPWIIDGGGAA